MQPQTRPSGARPWMTCQTKSLSASQDRLKGSLISTYSITRPPGESRVTARSKLQGATSNDFLAMP